MKYVDFSKNLSFSGLDSSTSTQLISLLKKLADEGRTIICTIHQPSALMFQMFDHLFAIADGQCIYTGSTNNLVPFLSELNLKCPESYNPADYRKCDIFKLEFYLKLRNYTSFYRILLVYDILINNYILGNKLPKNHVFSCSEIFFSRTQLTTQF